jgi:hypothetical protein
MLRPMRHDRAKFERIDLGEMGSSMLDAYKEGLLCT